MKYLNTYLTHFYYYEALETIVSIAKVNVEITKETVERNYSSVNEFVGAKPVKVLMDIRALGYHHIPKEAMRVVANNSFTHLQIKTAIIISGLGQKILANFYLTVMKPKSPTKIFTNEEEAIEWLGLSLSFFDLSNLPHENTIAK
jgi:hypothetical protein